MLVIKMRAIVAIFAAVFAAGALAQQDFQFDTGPFTQREAALMSAVWPEIREAESFDRIDWESVGLVAAPGDAQARRLMERHWDDLREAAEFSDIDWERTTAQRASSRDSFAQPDDDLERGPFTQREATLMSALWPQIREAETFEQIDWNAYRLNDAPGDARARRLMSRHWGSLRQAAAFGDIDWEATTEDRRR